ncbi:MAG: helix-turn-helix domain-containing protein [Ardenticatenaceae bacterium]
MNSQLIWGDKVIDSTARLPLSVKTLAPRELQLLRLLAAGFTAEQMADHLNLSFHTVRAYLQLLYAKLGANNAANAVALGLSYGLIEQKDVEAAWE